MVQPVEERETASWMRNRCRCFAALDLAVFWTTALRTRDHEFRSNENYLGPRLSRRKFDSLELFEADSGVLESLTVGS